jgi:multiple sugar transport system permease protein
MNTGKSGRRGYNPFLLVLLLAFIVCALFPVYWTLNTSLKTQQDIYSMQPSLWPKTVTFASYNALLFKKGFLLNIANSGVVSLIVVAISIFFSALAAYAFARVPFRNKRLLSNSILSAYLMPRSILFIPLYVLVTRMKLNNSLAGLIAIYPTFTIPYATWMLTSYFRSIPKSIEEAAEIDGSSRTKTMFSIVFPLAAPGIAATAIFSFTLCWNEYTYALVTITKSVAKTLTLALSDMVVADVYAWGPLMAGSIIATLPVMIMYISMSRYLVNGLTLGAVK